MSPFWGTLSLSRVTFTNRDHSQSFPAHSNCAKFQPVRTTQADGPRAPPKLPGHAKTCTRRGAYRHDGHSSHRLDAHTRRQSPRLAASLMSQLWVVRLGSAPSCGSQPKHSPEAQLDSSLPEAASWSSSFPVNVTPHLLRDPPYRTTDSKIATFHHSRHPRTQPDRAKW